MSLKPSYFPLWMVNGDPCNGLISLHNLGSMIPYIYIWYIYIYILNYICILNKIHYLADTTAPSPSTLAEQPFLITSDSSLLKQTNCTSGFFFANPMLIKVPKHVQLAWSPAVTIHHESLQAAQLRHTNRISLRFPFLVPGCFKVLHLCL